MRRRRRSPTSGVAGSGLLIVVLLLSGCSGDDSSSPSPASAAPSTTGTSDSAASHTPADLRHPCAVVPAREATRELGRPVTARRVAHPANVRRLECRYGPSLDIVSAPDIRSVGTIVGLYVGVDRLAHHPVEVAGADDAVVILNPGNRPSVTLFVQQGFVVHTVVIHAADPGRAERLAVRLAGLVVAGNPPG